ncbi:MAG: hypothetical protein KJ065_09015 [Anaerolineae bacterium]|nr:hypothetical protein [Anaerolineae bacterium]
MMSKLTPKIILEGTRLTHKTDLAFALNEHPRIVGPRKYQYHSPLISGEWCTFSNQPWGRGPINFQPDEEALAMETYHTWARLFELQRYYSWIIDRFHISTQVYQAHEGREYSFRWLEQRLKPLNFCVVLCTRKPDSFYAARAERLKVSGNPSQYDNLEIFIEEQADFRRVVQNSMLPWMEIDVTDGQFDAACEQIADWMNANDLLEMAN